MTDQVTPPEGFEPSRMALLRRELATGRYKRQPKHPFRHRRAKRQLFMDLPRRERRAKVVAMKWKIAQDTEGHGVFTTHVVLPGSRLLPDAADPLQLVSSILFLPRTPQPTWFYNARIETVAHRWASALIKHVEDTIQAQLSSEDRQREAEYIRTYSKRLPNGNSEMWFAPRQRFTSLGDRTEDGACAAWLREHWAALATLVPGVGPGAQFEENRKEWPGPGVQHGRPVSLLTTEANLSVAGIVRALDAFAAHGEGAYQEAPVPFDTVRATVEALLRVRLWRWEDAEARAQGQERPAHPSPEDIALADNSCAIRPSVWGPVWARQRKPRLTRR